MFPNETKRQTTQLWQRNETHRERNEPIGNETDVAAGRNDWRVESKRNVSNTKRNPSETKRNETKSPQAGQLIPSRQPAGQAARQQPSQPLTYLARNSVRVRHVRHSGTCGTSGRSGVRNILCGTSVWPSSARTRTGGTCQVASFSIVSCLPKPII